MGLTRFLWQYCSFLSSWTEALGFTENRTTILQLGTWRAVFPSVSASLATEQLYELHPAIMRGKMYKKGNNIMFRITISYLKFKLCPQPRFPLRHDRWNGLCVTISVPTMAVPCYTSHCHVMQHPVLLADYLDMATWPLTVKRALPMVRSSLGCWVHRTFSLKVSKPAQVYNKNYTVQWLNVLSSATRTRVQTQLFFTS